MSVRDVLKVVGKSGKPWALLGGLFLLLDAVLPGQANWVQRTPAVSPPARYFHAMAWDAGRNRVVMFGGGASGWAYLADTWEWDGASWTQRFPATTPSARLGDAMVYDSARGRVVLFGGGISSVHDTWEWDGTNWNQRSSANYPSPRSSHRMAYDAARGRIVLFGGYTPTPLPNGSANSETWEWDGTDWTQRNPATIPPARYIHAMAYDSLRGRVVMFAGLGSGFQFLGDTWEWDGTDWTQRSPATIPSATTYHAMTYDSGRGRVVLFGGDGPVNPSAETWEWDGSDWSQRTPATLPVGRIAHAMAYDAAHGRLVMFGGTTNQSNIRLGDTWEYGDLNPATYASFGAGCAGSAGVPTNIASTLPRMGQTMTVNLGNLPSPEIAFFAIGWSRTTSALGPLPLDLTGLGAPGCSGYVSFDSVRLLVGAGGAAVFQLVIPASQSYLGLGFFAQALALDPGWNALGAAVSNAAEATIGN